MPKERRSARFGTSWSIFRLNDEGELELKEFGESCWDAILEKAYPRLVKAMNDHADDTVRARQRRKNSDGPGWC
jgi:hypothetical protein